MSWSLYRQEDLQGKQGQPALAACPCLGLVSVVETRTRRESVAEGYTAARHSVCNSRLCPAPATLVIAVSRRRTRADVAHAQSPTRVSAVLVHALADTQPLHELRPPLQHGLLPLLLLSLRRRGVLDFPVLLYRSSRR